MTLSTGPNGKKPSHFFAFASTHSWAAGLWEALRWEFQEL